MKFWMLIGRNLEGRELELLAAKKVRRRPRRRNDLNNFSSFNFRLFSSAPTCSEYTIAAVSLIFKELFLFGA